MLSVLEGGCREEGLPSDDICDNGTSGGAAEPDSPMSERVTRKVWAALHQPQEDVFGRKLSISSILPLNIRRTWR
jgi:hypothetical protein